MHHNPLHGLLVQTNTAGVSRMVAALNHVSVTASKTAQKFRELQALSQFFLRVLCVSMVSQHFALAFAPNSLIPAELHYPSASAAKAANFSLIPAVVLQ